MKDLVEKRIGNHLKILVAEDSGLSFALTEALIERLTGNYPERAINGAEAVKMAESGDYDLIIMDQLMPKMSGIEATLNIRNLLPKWKQPFIAGLSGAASSFDVSACEAAGMDRFLAKPMRLAHLKTLLELVLSRAASDMEFEIMDGLQVSVA